MGTDVGLDELFLEGVHLGRSVFDQEREAVFDPGRLLPFVLLVVTVFVLAAMGSVCVSGGGG